MEVDVVGEGVGFESEGHALSIISWFRCGVRRAALLKWSMKGQSVSSCSCLTLRSEIIVV